MCPFSWRRVAATHQAVVTCTHIARAHPFAPSISAGRNRFHNLHYCGSAHARTRALVTARTNLYLFSDRPLRGMRTTRPRCRVERWREGRGLRRALARCAKASTGTLSWGDASRLRRDCAGHLRAAGSGQRAVTATGSRQLPSAVASGASDGSDGSARCSRYSSIVVPSCVRIPACVTRATRPRILTSPTPAVARDSSTIASIVSWHRNEPRTAASRPDRLMLTVWPGLPHGCPDAPDAHRDIQRKPRRARRTLDDGHVWQFASSAGERPALKRQTYHARRRHAAQWTASTRSCDPSGPGTRAAAVQREEPGGRDGGSRRPGNSW